MRAHGVAAALLLGWLMAACAAQAPAVLSPFVPPPRQMQEFDDCAGEGWCPTMVIIPGGGFMMGSPQGEEGRGINEGPYHHVNIRPFAIGKFELTWDQWQVCVDDGGCAAHQGIDAGNGWGRGSQPVINVSWNDAQAYVRWLSHKTHHAYRLLTEAEWEYAARAGTTTRYSWGDDDPVCDQTARNGANYSSCTDDRARPVGSFSPNPFGLYDMHGNVYEWLQDCYTFSYESLPDDGSAAQNDECYFHMMRGGSWASYAPILRSAYRMMHDPRFRNPNLGIRVARNLN